MIRWWFTVQINNKQKEPRRKRSETFCSDSFRHQIVETVLNLHYFHVKLSIKKTRKELDPAAMKIFQCIHEKDYPMKVKGLTLQASISYREYRKMHIYMQQCGMATSCTYLTHNNMFVWGDLISVHKSFFSLYPVSYLALPSYFT